MGRLHPATGGTVNEDDRATGATPAQAVVVPARAAASEEVLTRLLMESTDDYAIFMLDPQGRVASWNAGAERLTGYRRDEIVGRHLSILFPPDAVASGHPDHGLRVATQEGRFAEEGWRVRKDGTRLWASVTVTALRTDEGELVGFGKLTRDLTERQEREQRLAAQATRDPLTGLANRSLLFDRLQHALARAERDGVPLAALFIDLDGFKAVNDTAGHLAGDAVLVEVARRLEAALRPYDSVARLGGDEFVVVAEVCPRPVAEELAARIREAVEAPIGTLAVGCSVGLAFSRPGTTAEDLLRRADHAMYRAKHERRRLAPP